MTGIEVATGTGLPPERAPGPRAANTAPAEAEPTPAHGFLNVSSPGSISTPGPRARRGFFVAAPRAHEVPRDLSQNLDEFFEVRVSGLMEQLDAGLPHHHLRWPRPRRSAPRHPKPHRAARRPPSRRLRNEVVPALEEAGSARTDWERFPSTTGPRRRDVAEADLPVLTPLAVDPAASVPYISNLSLKLAVDRGAIRRTATSVRTREGAAFAPALRRLRGRARPRCRRRRLGGRRAARCGFGWRGADRRGRGHRRWWCGGRRRSCSMRPETRTSKNSSRFWLKIARTSCARGAATKNPRRARDPGVEIEPGELTVQDRGPASAPASAGAVFAARGPGARSGGKPVPVATSIPVINKILLRPF